MNDNELGKIGPVPLGCGENQAILRSRPRPWSHQSLRARPRLDGFSLATPSIPVELTGPKDAKGRRIAAVTVCIHDSVGILARPWRSFYRNIARITGLVLLLVAVPAVLQSWAHAQAGALQWLTLALYLWFCCSYFWSATPDVPRRSGSLRRIFPGDDAGMAGLGVCGDSPRSSQPDARMACGVVKSLAPLLTIAQFLRCVIRHRRSRSVLSLPGRDPNDVLHASLTWDLPVAALLLPGGTGAMARTPAGSGVHSAGFCVRAVDRIAQRIPGGAGRPRGLRDDFLSTQFKGFAGRDR